jgi:hypothetical protein
MCLAAILMTVGATALHAGVVELFVPDENYEGGGYYELTVTNTTATDQYMLSVGNNGADVVFTAPELVGQWRARRDQASNWDAGLTVSDAGFTFPPTHTLQASIYFPGAPQILTYYVRAASPPSIPGGSPISPGSTLSGLRFLSSGAGSPYVLFDVDGSILEQGETTHEPTQVVESSWGAIKALSR